MCTANHLGLHALLTHHKYVCISALQVCAFKLILAQVWRGNIILFERNPHLVSRREGGHWVFINLLLLTPGEAVLSHVGILPWTVFAIPALMK